MSTNSHPMTDARTEAEALPHSPKQAISDLLWMRETHVQWAEYFEKHPKIEAQYVATRNWDDAKEHRRIVTMYDNAIACLAALQGQAQ